jgi:hypothetical protein
VKTKGIIMASEIKRPIEEKIVLSQTQTGSESDNCTVLALEGMTCASCAMRMHCLSRNLTVRSTRNTLLGIIISLSTIPPLHQFPFAEKTESLL